MTVDEKTIELAKHFLLDVPGATTEDETELAESIQSVCEDFCRTFEDSVPNPDACEHDFRDWRSFPDGKPWCPCRISRILVRHRGMLTINLVDCTRVLLEEIAAKPCKQKDVALTYAMAMKSLLQGHDTPDWTAINTAIIERWSRAGLERVKTMAHRQLAEWGIQP